MAQKVHLICTPEFDIDCLNGAVKLLGDIKGPIEFSNAGKNTMPFLKSEFYWDEIFEYCTEFRKRNAIPAEDIVGVLTSLFNTKSNYFSMFDVDRRVFFVTTFQWEVAQVNIRKATPMLYAAFETAENVIQILMNMNEMEAHFTTIGCINDMCVDKKQISAKLRARDPLCDSCVEIALERGVSTDVIEQISEISRHIGEGFLVKRKSEPIKFNLSFVAETVKRRQTNFEFRFPKVEQSVYLQPKLLVFYLYLLFNNGKVKKHDIHKALAEMTYLYKNVCHAKDIQRADTIMWNLGEKKNYEQLVSNLNRAFGEVLGVSLSDRYKIKSDNGHYMLECLDEFVETPDSKALKIKLNAMKHEQELRNGQLPPNITN